MRASPVGGVVGDPCGRVLPDGPRHSTRFLLLVDLASLVPGSGPARVRFCYGQAPLASHSLRPKPNRFTKLSYINSVKSENQ